MHFRISLLGFIVLPAAVFFSPSKKDIQPGSNASIRYAADYYQENTNLSRRFCISYSKLVSGARGYSKKDSLKAGKLLTHLYKSNHILFYRMMRIRLEWEFKEHLSSTSLDSLRGFLRTNFDSAQYYYLMANYFKDSMYERIARKMGYVKSTSTGEEVVYWERMKGMIWRNPKFIEARQCGALFETKVTPDLIRDTVLLYYKKAIRSDPSEFYYMEALLSFLYQHGEDNQLRELIVPAIADHSGREKERLGKYLDASSVSKPSDTIITQ